MTTTTSDKDPVHRGRLIYEQEVCARSFDEDFILHWHNPSAIVYKDQDSLAWLRPVNIHDHYLQLTDPSYNTPTPNAWWIYLFVGNFVGLINQLPVIYPYIGWERDNKARFYTYNHFTKWTSKDHTLINRLLGRTAS